MTILSLSSLSANLPHYYNQLPNNILKSVIQSATLSFVTSTIISSNVGAGFTHAMLGITASTIHALITPIFKYIWKPAHQVTEPVGICRLTVTYFSTALLTVYITKRTDLFELVLTTLIAHLFLNRIFQNSSAIDLDTTQHFFFS